jgi:glycosyltransferase involved in cell wall biosynthesis
MVKTSIVLLTKDDLTNIEPGLNVIYRQKNVEPFEVIVIDSGSSDGTLDVLRNFPVRLYEIPPDSFHHGRTRNLGASIATGEILVFLSQDALPVSDSWLDAMLSNFHDPSVGAVYGRQLPRPHSTLERRDALDAVYGGKKLIKDPAHRNGMGYRFYHFSDVNSAIRRSVWDAVRFPEDLKVFEDIGIAKRILDRGWKIVYEPGAAVVHSHSYTALGLFKRYFDIGYTLKLLQIWDEPGIKKTMVRDLWRLLKGKVRLARNNGDSRSACEGFGQDIAKSAGLLLGLNQELLPLALKRRLSACVFK